MKSDQIKQHLPLLTLGLIVIGVFIAVWNKGYLAHVSGSGEKYKSSKERVAVRALTPDDNEPETATGTENWITYTDNSSHIQFRYPSTFTYKEDRHMEDTDFPQRIFSTNFFNGETLFNVAAYKNDDNYSLDTILTEGPFMKYASGTPESIRTTRTKLGGEVALIAQDIKVNERIQTPIYLSSPFTDVFIVKQGIIYKFELNKDNNAQSRKIFNDILETIKFVGQ